MTQAITPPGFSILRGVQLTKEVSYLNMRTAAAAAALSKLWSDTFLTNAGIDAGESSGYTYRGSANYDVIRAAAGSSVIGGGTASQSSTNAGRTAGLAFDGNAATYSQTASTSGNWIKYDLGSGNAKTAVKYSIQAEASAAGGAPKDFVFQGSNNDTDWTDLDTKAGIIFSAGEVKEYTFSNSTPYRYYRLNVTAQNNGAYFMEIAEIVIYEAAASSAVVQSVRALNLADDVTSVIPFVDMTLNTGALDLVEVSTDDGATWTTVTPDQINTVPAGAQIKMRVTFSGDAELESWGIAA